MIGADRSKRGILFADSPAALRQRAYTNVFGHLDIIGFSRTSDKAKEYADAHLHVYPTNSSTRFFYGRDAIRLAKNLPRPSVVSAQDPFETGLMALRIAKRFKVPLHVQVHTDFLSPAYRAQSLANHIRVLIAGFVLKRATRVRVVSERIKKEIEQKYYLRVPISVLPIFVDVARFGSTQTSAELVAKFKPYKMKLLVVARLEPEKNVELAVRAFAGTSPEDTCLIIVGAGSARAALERLARDLSITERVYFEGEQPASTYYPLADLILVPSRYEGYGMVIVEALAAGKPVLSTDVGIAREGGAIVTNERDFATDLKKWFENGPRTAVLNNYPYKDFDEYVRAYCDDILACTKAK